MSTRSWDSRSSPFTSTSTPVWRCACEPDPAMNEFARELDVAIEAARRAGARLMEHYRAGSVAVETKSDSSPVTAADREANDIILEVLRSAFTEDGLLSE